ncbi:MAG: HIT family protein [Chitinophagales bacterium]
MNNCIFCEIIAKKADANIVFENDTVVAFLDIDPISDGHILVVPKNHIRDIHTLDEKTGSEIMKIAKKMADIIKNTFNFNGIMLMEVNGDFQDVPHFHMHVFGRNKENDIKFQYPQNQKTSKIELNKIAQKIKFNL